MKILLIDNNDSFTYNLLHLIKSVCNKDDSVEIYSNKLTTESAACFDRIIISPGPGTPSESLSLSKIIHAYEQQIPILGICLGHQVIAESYGANTYNLKHPVHGIRSEVTILDHSDLFYGIEQQIMVGRYHSWCVSNENLPDCLKATAVDSEGNIMALSHSNYNLFGIQFHPESFMTERGKNIVSNFLTLTNYDSKRS